MRQHPLRKRTARRSGTVYLAVVWVAFIVTTMTLAAMQIARLQLKEAEHAEQRKQTRLLALAAIEHALAEFNSNSNWKTDYAFNTEYPATPVALNGGQFTWKLIDAGGGQYQLDGIGRYGADPQCVFRVDLKETPSLDCAVLAGGNATFESGATSFTANGAPVATNGSLTVQFGMTVFADVEAQSILNLGGISGSQTAPAATRTLPSEDVYDYYLANGTVITPPIDTSGPEDVALIQKVLLSPTSNPYGTPNADGIYIVDTSGFDLDIEDSRIVGTLVVDHSGGVHDAQISGSVNWEPAYPNFPALLVKGNLDIKVDHAPLDESALGMPNFNPSGTPYQGATDSQQDDVYESSIAGIFYCGGELLFKGDYTPKHQGLFISGGILTAQSKAAPTIEYDPIYAADPPPGFGSAVPPVGPTLAKSYVVSGGSTDDIQSDKKWGQYFIPDLPAEAVTWKVDSVDIWVVRDGSGGNIDVGLYLPDGGNLPDTQIDTVSVADTEFGWVYAWYNVPFSGHTGLTPGQGLCLTLTSTEAVAPARLEYQASGVSQTNAGMISGNAGGWTTYDPNAAIGYRVNVTYTTASGNVGIVPGSWRQTPMD